MLLFNIGIKANTEPGLDVFVLEAFDEDATATPITYDLVDVKFYFVNTEPNNNILNIFIFNDTTFT